VFWFEGSRRFEKIERSGLCTVPLPYLEKQRVAQKLAHSSKKMRAKAAEKAKQQWADPIARAKKSEEVSAYWARKRAKDNPT
jgi:hypothetical protein